MTFITWRSHINYCVGRTLDQFRSVSAVKCKMGVYREDCEFCHDCLLLPRDLLCCYCRPFPLTIQFTVNLRVTLAWVARCHVVNKSVLSGWRSLPVGGGGSCDRCWQVSGWGWGVGGSYFWLVLHSCSTLLPLLLPEKKTLAYCELKSDIYMKYLHVTLFRGWFVHKLDWFGVEQV